MHSALRIFHLKEKTKDRRADGARLMVWLISGENNIGTRKSMRRPTQAQARQVSMPPPVRVLGGWNAYDYYAATTHTPRGILLSATPAAASQHQVQSNPLLTSPGAEACKGGMRGTARSAWEEWRKMCKGRRKRRRWRRWGRSRCRRRSKLRETALQRQICFNLNKMSPRINF